MQKPVYSPTSKFIFTLWQRKSWCIRMKFLLNNAKYVPLPHVKCYENLSTLRLNISTYPQHVWSLLEHVKVVLYHFENQTSMQNTVFFLVFGLKTLLILNIGSQKLVWTCIRMPLVCIKKTMKIAKFWSTQRWRKTVKNWFFAKKKVFF